MTKIIIINYYLSNIWRSPEMIQIICEINLILNWSANCVSASNQANQKQIKKQNL